MNKYFLFFSDAAGSIISTTIKLNRPVREGLRQIEYE